jgi:isopenicillin-N epimerase
MVAKNFPLQPGDQILTTDIEYGACDRTWEYYCAQKGATYVKQKISLPITSKEKFIEEFFAGITPKTKAVFISHITSATALKLPVEEICAMAKQKGLITFVDGAHGPAQTEVNLATLQADFYTGACHKCVIHWW